MVRRASLAAPALLLGASICVCLVAAELTLRATAAGREISPGNELINARILEPDVETLVRLRADIDVSMEAFWPDWPVRIRTNASGQRMDRPLPSDAGDETYRIATLGDSSTMGWGVDVERAYPEILEGLLTTDVPKLEVLNFGTVGFSSHNGLAQLRADVLPLRPDLVTLAFGFNDASEQRGSDAERHEHLILDRARRESSWLVDGATRALHSLELARRVDALWFPAPQWRFRKRVPLPEYRSNLAEMIRECRGIGADVVLVDLNLPNSYGRSVLEALAAENRIPLVQVRDLFERERGAETRAPGAWLATEGSAAKPPADAESARVLFRAWAPEGSGEPILVRLPHGQLFDPSRDALELYDDGSHGDQVAGDRVFSRLAPLDPERPDYAYPFAEVQERGGLRRSFMSFFYHRLPPAADGEGVQLPPVKRVASVPLRPFLIPWDAVHPNARGHRLVAAAIARSVRETQSFEAFRQLEGNDPDREEWFRRRRRFFSR